MEKRKVKDLKPYPGNPRKMTRAVLEKLKASLLEFGVLEPLIINSQNEVIGGNQRLKAMKELHIKETNVIVVDFNKKKEKALNIALNKIQGSWDYPLLSDMLQEIKVEPKALELTGFDDKELDQLMDEFLQESDPNFKYKNKCPRCGFEW